MQASPNVIGAAVTSYCPPNAPPASGTAMKRSFRRGNTVSRTFMTGVAARRVWWWSNYFRFPDRAGNIEMIGNGFSIDVSEQKTQEQKLNFLAYYDALTGLPNRALFDERLNARLKNSSATSRTALIVTNIDRFAIVNNSLVKQGGDTLLREMAGRLKAAWPDADGVAHIMADSFAGLLVDIGDEAELARASWTISWPGSSVFLAS
jgi:predicted signal transduction protein with EAL and GGDEF domain